MGKVVDIQAGLVKHTPDDVLEDSKGVFESVLVLGWDIEGDLSVGASSDLTLNEVLWILETFKYKLLGGEYE